MKPPRLTFPNAVLGRVVAVLDAPTNSFVALARIAGLDPARDFHGADLRGVDFGTDDLSGFRFFGADLRSADLSRTRGLKYARFDGAKTEGVSWPTDWLIPSGEAAEPRTLPWLDAIPQCALTPKILDYDPTADTSIVDGAYELAATAHSGQRRENGDAYFTHPVAVAEILVALRLDVRSIVTALLHDVVEDTAYKLTEIEARFGQEIAGLVDGVTTLTRLEQRSDRAEQAETFHKLILAISSDIRVLLVKLADRLHNMRTLHSVNDPKKRERFARETMEIFAPLAERIGMDTIKTELQTLAFTHMEPEVYALILERLKSQKVRDMLAIVGDLVGQDEFLENTKLELYSDQVFCFTPKGHLIDLPRGATPVDFAYAVHTHVGDTCVAAKVNGRLVPLRHQLENGDQVEIIIARGGTPSPQWDRFVVTSKARSRVRRFIHQEQRQQALDAGRVELAKAFRQAGVDVSEKALEPALKALKIASVEDLYIAVGSGTLASQGVVQATYPELLRMSGPPTIPSNG
jgi:(p)ppGpp synthase/HD superfamily hydrolase